MPKVTESTDKFNIEGILLAREPMWRHTTFAVGGPADLFAVPEGENDLRTLLTAGGSLNTDVFILGGGSNILVADPGIRGLVIDMRRFREITIENGMAVLGAGMDVSDAAWQTGSAGMAGLDFLFGMPGSVGGALWMNARCYDREIADCLAWVETMDRAGRVRREPVDRKDWSYKTSPFQTGDQTILRAAFNLRESNAAALKKSMTEKRDDRESKGHYRYPCAGSAFKNNRDFGEPSGKIIDRCGLKGMRIGGACVSPWHGNIFINDRGASARDIRDLLNEVGLRVEKGTGYHLEPEILPVGDWRGE